MQRLYKFFLVFVLFFSLGVHAEKIELVTYQIDIEQPQHHLANIAVHLPQTDSNEVVVMLPAWRTGKYEILNLASGITNFVAKDNAGKVLSTNKLDKSTWSISLAKPSSISISYQLYANQLGQRTRHIDDSHMFLDATAGLIYQPELRDHPIKVKLNVPEGWESRSGMTSPAKHEFIAANYDVLVDSPIESGIHDYHEFKLGKQKYGVLFWGAGSYDQEQIIEDIKKIIPQGKKIWGSYPYEYYLFMIHATAGERGATEHVNSTVIQVPREKLFKRKDYVRFIQTVAHEFVHTWNVKAYRPQGIWNYDYQTENYSKLLWLAEGSTSYYDALLSLRANVIKPTEYMQHLGKLLDQHIHTPGRFVTSPAHASWDKWISTKDKHENQNLNVSIYNQGELISLLLDIEMRAETNGKYGYEDLHRRLYEEFSIKQKAFSESDLLAILKSITKKDFSNFFAKYINGVSQPDWNEVLEQVGLEFSFSGGKEKPIAWAGMTLDKKEKQKVLVVEKDSPAWKAGITVGDELVAINGIKIKQEWSEQLKQHKPEEVIQLTYFRRDELQVAEIILSEIADGVPLAKPQQNVTRRQKRLFKAWSGISWSDFVKKDDGK